MTIPSLSLIHKIILLVTILLVPLFFLTHNLTCKNVLLFLLQLPQILWKQYITSMQQLTVLQLLTCLSWHVALTCGGITFTGLWTEWNQRSFILIFPLLLIHYCVSVFAEILSFSIMPLFWTVLFWTVCMLASLRIACNTHQTSQFHPLSVQFPKKKFRYNTKGYSIKAWRVIDKTATTRIWKLQQRVR